MRRVLLFLLLLSLGVGLLIVLAERQSSTPLRPEEIPSVPAPSLSDEAAKAPTSMKKLHLTQSRPSGSTDGAMIAESELWADEALDQGNGYWILRKVKIRLLQEKNPERESFFLDAAQGLVALSGAFGDLSVDPAKPVHFEDVIADFYDAQGNMPPIRIRTPSLEGQLQERRFWTDGPFTLGQPEGDDFEGGGEGLEGNATDGSVSLKKNPSLRHRVRAAPGAPVERELRLRCAGPLRIGRPTIGPETPSPGARLAQAKGNALLEIREMKSGSLQTVRAERIQSWMRSERDVPASQDPGKKKLPFAFERIEATENVRIENAQALLFGDYATALVAKSGRIESLEIEGHPRAAFSSASASSLTRATSGQSQAIFVQCEGPLELSESPESEGEMRMRFERNVLLFGTGSISYLPSRFGSQLDLQFEKALDSSGSGETSFRILGGQADGGVSWRGAGASVFAPTMRMKPNAAGGTQIVFSPSPLLETQFASAAFSPGVATPAARTLSLFAQRRIVQNSAPDGGSGGETTLEGLVWGHMYGGADADRGRLESNGLHVLNPRPGVTQLTAEHGFFYEEGSDGLRLRADRVEPFGDQGMRLIGAPAELRQPGAQGRSLDIAASAIAFDPISGEFRAQGGVSATLPQESAEPLRLYCQVLEGARGESAQMLRRLEAFQEVKLRSQGQDAGGESLQVDFAEKVHRIFGTDERLAWLSGPMDQGHFAAKSRRIEIRDGGSSIRLAPGAQVEIRGKAVNFGALTSSAKGAEGVRVLPKGESRIEKEAIVFSGGVRLETLAPTETGGWTLSCRELRLERDPATGELHKMEAREDVRYVSQDIVASGIEMDLWPKTNELLLLGDERLPAVFQIPLQQFSYSSTRIQYNLATHLLKSGAGVAIPTR